MLNQTVVSPPAARARSGGALGIGSAWTALRVGLYAGPHAWLKQLVLIFTIACVLMCAYLWQSSALAALQKDTRETQRAVAQLERDNVALMLQVAQWHNPAYIQDKARRSGLTTERAALVLEVPLPTATPAPTRPIAEVVLAEATTWWRQLMAGFSGSAAAIAPAAAFR